VVGGSSGLRLDVCRRYAACKRNHSAVLQNCSSSREQNRTESASKASKNRGEYARSEDERVMGRKIPQ
jgi:hypothetical protein